MNPDNQEKTSFITNKETYCYNVMLFEVKNAWVTYQHLVTQMFKGNIKNHKKNIDDMLVKKVLKTDHLSHLRKTFTTLQKYNMNLNPKKCPSRVVPEKILGFLVSNTRVKVNLHQIKVIVGIPDILRTKNCNS